VAWLVIVVPGVAPALTVAVMVIVTLPPAGTPPSQFTVLPAVAAVPEVAVALTRVRAAGRVSVSSCPGLSVVAEPPELVITMV